MNYIFMSVLFLAGATLYGFVSEWTAAKLAQRRRQD